MANNHYDDNASLILVMGVTGAGKSYFNKVTGSTSAITGNSLHSCTSKAIVIGANIGKQKVVLIDTPGFDDTTRSDSEILTEICQLLSAQYKVGLKLKGVIFLHRITDLRWQGSSMKTLSICKKICGDTALKNVLLVTSRWNEIDPAVGAQRENELRDDIWKFMLNFGSTMMRYHGDEASAVTIASQLLNKDSIVLEIQRELVDQGKELRDTAAGAFVNDRYEEKRLEHEQGLKEIEQLRRDLLENDRQMRAQMMVDWNKERDRLRAAQEHVHAQQLALQRPVGQEVCAEVKKKRSTLGKMLPFLPSALSILGTFVGIPPGTLDIFSSWFSGMGLGDSMTDLFSSF